VSREVITVTGPVAPEALGITSMHEHVLADGSCYAWPPERVPADLAHAAGRAHSLETIGAARRQLEVSRDNLVVDDADLVGAELAEFRDQGGGTVVDMSVPGMRVDAAALPGISERSGVRIVTGTGMYIAASRPRRLREMTIDELAAWMVGEIEQGIDDTGVRAGQIGELGITELDQADRLLLHAAVRAAEATGVSISIHPGFEDGTDGRAIATVLEQAGATPERVVLGHGDAFLSEHSLARLVDDPGSWTLRLDYHRDLLTRGYNLSIDCFGHDWGREDDGWVIETDWQRLAGLAALVREGFADQLVLGCDVFTRSLHRRGGGFGYRHLLDWVLPRLRERGIDEATIEKLTVANPARILSREVH
jgi:phosphotriesterase-related protein